MITQLETMINDYVEQAREVSGKVSTFAVLMGNREDTKHPCHAVFYDGVKGWTDRFAATSPEQVELCRALELLLLSAERYDRSAPYWYLIAIQAHAKLLIPMLDDTHRTVILKRFEKTYPRDKRLPLQEEILMLLGGKKRKLFGFL